MKKNLVGAALVAVLALTCASSFAATYDVPFTGTWTLKEPQIDGQPPCPDFESGWCVTKTPVTTNLELTTPRDGDGWFWAGTTASMTWAPYTLEGGFNLSAAEGDYINFQILGGDVHHLTVSSAWYPIVDIEGVHLYYDYGMSAHSSSVLTGLLAVPEPSIAALELSALTLALLAVARSRRRA